jgi:hypothetical protein
MEPLKVRGMVVGTVNGKNKNDQPYTLVTAVIGGEPMTLRLERDGGTLDGIQTGTEQALVLSLSAYRTEARVGFIGVDRKAA